MFEGQIIVVLTLTCHLLLFSFAKQIKCWKSVCLHWYFVYFLVSSWWNWWHRELAGDFRVVWRENRWHWSRNWEKPKRKRRQTRNQTLWKHIWGTWSSCQRWSDQLSAFTTERPSARWKSNQKWSATTWANSRSHTSLSNTVAPVSVPLTLPDLFHWNNLVFVQNKNIIYQKHKRFLILH